MKPFWPLWAALFLAPILGWLSALILLAVAVATLPGHVEERPAEVEDDDAGEGVEAGLDVLEGEPEIAEHPLVCYSREKDNLLITPHCGGFSPDAVRKVCAHAATKIRAVLAT